MRQADCLILQSNRVDCFPCFKIPPTTSSMDLGAAASQGIVSKFIRVWYASALLKKPVKYLVLVLFSGFFVLSWIGSRHIKLGLGEHFPYNLILFFGGINFLLSQIKDWRFRQTHTSSITLTRLILS